jgi:diadenosine tetraphosphatase ApaH/serine/threonine PP2A family protein phosphatase
VTAGGWLDWLSALPLEQRFTLPDGTVVLATHVAPGQDDGAGIHLALSDAEMAADLVCIVHTHRPLDRTVSNIRVVNTGSISNPMPSDPRASYALVEATPLGYSVRHRRVAYDYAAVIAAVQHSRHPSGDYIIGHFRGQRRPGTPDE